MVVLLAVLAFARQMPMLDLSKQIVRGTGVGGVQCQLKEKRGVYQAELTNSGQSAKIDEVVICDIPTHFPEESGLYGEGFTMLSQTGGTIGHPVDIGAYTDHRHYKMPMPAEATTVYNVLTISPPGKPTILMGFTTCRRFSGHFNVFRDHIEVVVDTEGLVLAPGESWRLEDFWVDSGNSRQVLFQRFGQRVSEHAGRLRFSAPPTGWCSWQCFGPSVTAHDVQANIETIAKRLPDLKYIQIDDGYQAKTGDWLETGSSFGGGIRQVLSDIRAKGLEPAIWVAPFVATEDSRLFKDHPDWFVRDELGKPLRSDRVTFGGWHKLPWYVLDGTHPGAQKYLTHVFRTMREDWGCTYFKMDAITWGAIKGGHFYDPKATRIEAYHRGMQAIRKGAGEGFLLGCNHPLWPSIGFIDGQRSGMDIERSWPSFSSTAKENLSRAWQNGKLWWNDPDTLLLTGDLPANEYQFHATVILATGGLVLSGDNVPDLKQAMLKTIRKLLPPTGVAAQFQDDSFTVGETVIHDETRVFLLNWSDAPMTKSFHMKHRAEVTDFWNGKVLGQLAGTVTVELAPRSARVLVYK